MDKQQHTKGLKMLFYYWRAQDRSFRIAVWTGLFLISSILYLHHYLEPLAADTEFITENDVQEDFADVGSSEDETSRTLEQHTDESIESLQEHEFAVKVQAGDTLSDIFTRYEINNADLYAILALKEAKSILAHLNPGQEVYLTIDSDHNLVKLSTQIAFNKTLHITRPIPEFQVKIEEQEAETQLTTASGVIRSSLYRSTQAAKIPQKIALQLTQVFSGKLNFARDLRPGDSYKLIYQRRVINDTTVGVGDIIAAEVMTQGRTVTAIRYESKTDGVRYYTPDGQGLQKAFVRNPLNFSRISSKFNPQRMHPILKIKRPHYGVDYAAPSGTIVKAVGDGKIVFAGKKGGYGNVIIINHGGNITTHYGHLKKFAQNIHAGTRILKGDTIGYVGSTGLATGPHLHYEYRVKGKAVNPLTVALPESYTIPRGQLAKFKRLSAPLLAELHNENQTQFAQTDITPKKSV